jgi:hypothetical protein
MADVSGEEVLTRAGEQIRNHTHTHTHSHVHSPLPFLSSFISHLIPEAVVAERTVLLRHFGYEFTLIASHTITALREMAADDVMPFTLLPFVPNTSIISRLEPLPSNYSSRMILFLFLSLYVIR